MTQAPDIGRSMLVNKGFAACAPLVRPRLAIRCLRISILGAASSMVVSIPLSHKPRYYENLDRNEHSCQACVHEYGPLTCPAKHDIMHIQMTLIGLSSVSASLGKRIVEGRTAALKIRVFQNPLA